MLQFLLIFAFLFLYFQILIYNGSMLYLIKKNISSLSNSVQAMILTKHVGDISEPNLKIYL